MCCQIAPLQRKPCCESATVNSRRSSVVAASQCPWTVSDARSKQRQLPARLLPLGTCQGPSRGPGAGSLFLPVRLIVIPAPYGKSLGDGMSQSSPLFAHGAPPRPSVIPNIAALSPSETRFVRLIIGICLLLLGAGTLSCRLDGLAIDSPANRQDMDWVRTTYGWERRVAWAPSEIPPVSLNPLVVAAGQAMLSILALAYYSENAEKRPPSEPSSV
jgi:hypothetical protein